ncbi:endosomal peripheral membrane protein-like protein [Calycina marina]|uniref:Endosomal peripheral membrane protein-like protein n=1 Tax=Calycina marina TaxID=1763456 RepID=A0A9P7Z3A0_9HELO|nr:endosomal peripheral membrane protein-like protein [Calycina marina]
MATQTLVSELTNLIQESKRKHTELRNAAEKSLDEIKALRSTSETQTAADLSQRPNFITPFLIACGTKNVKFTGIAVVCLNRLAVLGGLPRSRLREVLEAFRDANGAGIDVQLKILQTLPSLILNYPDDIKGELLAAALNICTALQSSKNPSVNNIAAATLQPLVVSVFDKVIDEDKIALEVPTIGEAPSDDGPIQLRAAALDAYRVFNDLCLLTEADKPLFLKSIGIPQTFGLELIESVLTNHSEVFLSHPEQANILRQRVMPFIISSLSEKLNFAVTVRIVRILYTLLKGHLDILTSEGEMALGLLTHMLDQDTALWKRSLCLEVLRDIFVQASLIRRIYAMYDAQDGRKPILRDLVAAFVRISTEKPVLIGLSQQSTIPSANQNNNGSEQAMLEASGVSGIITSPSGPTEPSAGLSTQWSSMKVACIDQLDKVNPPMIPETYIYSLTLTCIGGFADGLAKFILPLTVPEKPRKKALKQSEVDPSTPSDFRSGAERTTATSFKKNPVPANPLSLGDHTLFDQVKICAGIVEDCWPAVLATCSTLLYAALDSEYYHTLVRSFQRFAHVAGLLRLSTPRDAFLTTLGKAAVPPQLLTASSTQQPPTTPPTQNSSMFSNARGLLSVDSLVSQPERKAIGDDTATTLNTRNLLCLRALLNLGIALGPTLDTAWVIILGTLQEADLVLFSSAKSIRTPVTVQKSETQIAGESQLMMNFGTEVKAVETAASRLLESTIDFPNTAFLEVLAALCKLLTQYKSSTSEQSVPSSSTLSIRRGSFQSHRRIASTIAAPAKQNQEDLFALAKLGDISSINMDRFMTFEPEESGWSLISSELVDSACSPPTATSVRLRAAEIIVRLVLESATISLSLPDDPRGIVQLRLLETLDLALKPLQLEDRQMPVAVHLVDIDVHRIILEGLKSLLEQCGETFVSGWDTAFKIVGSVFIESLRNGKDRRETSSKASTGSARLIRSAFSSLQLICSDFLSSLPNSCFLILVDTLYRFCTQDDDLNISLTTVTFFWVLSDFISGRTTSFTVTSDHLNESDDQNLVKLASGDGKASSDAALWMLLLLRLTAVTTDERLELRNSAIQTLLRIFDAYGDQLSAEAWSVCLRSVMFKLLTSIEERLQSTHEDGSDISEQEKTGWNETTVVVLNGITKLLADYLDVLSDHHTFKGSWQSLLDHFKTLLSYEVMEINTAVFKSLRQLLSRGNMKHGKTNFDKASVDLAWCLWSDCLPTVSRSKYEKAGKTKAFNNQDYFLSYVSAFQEVYRLIEPQLDVDRVKTMLKLMRVAIQQASAATYSADIDYLTPLQSQVLESLKMIRTNIKGIPAALISHVAEFVALAYEPKSSNESKQQPTYVALSKASMILSESLITAHCTDTSIYTSGSVLLSLKVLAQPIVLKYAFPIISKSISPWRQSTISSLAILKAILPTITSDTLGEEVVRPIWASIVTIANGLTSADCEEAHETTDIKADQEFDVTSFLSMRELITPALGSSTILDKSRRAYMESLFRMSLIHAPQPQELPQVSQELLAVLTQPRRGSTTDSPPSARAKMSYICIDELLSLVAVHDSSPARVKLAQAAAPYLILRAGLTLRAYIADQPLRGHMPQPLSQRKELLYILKALVNLRCEPEGIPDMPAVESEGKKHLLRLYPLLSRAVPAASKDQEVLEWVGKALYEVGLEFAV